MMVWRNGEINEAELVKFASGWNAIDGNWYHGFTPATLARHRALIRRALRRTGRLLALSTGWSTYRPRFAQQIAKDRYGIGAATVGTSSHGGFWEGRETLAGDYGNWAWVYEKHGGRAAFFEDARAVGLSPNMISPGRGYPDEPWHLIDLNPKSAVPIFGDEPQPAPVAPPKMKEPNMRTIEWGGHWFTFGEEKVTHKTEMKLALASVIIHNPNREEIHLDNDGLTTLLHDTGVPWSAVDACMRGLAYDINGTPGGHYWSRAIEQKIDTANLGRNLANSLDELRKSTETVPAPTE